MNLNLIVLSSFVIFSHLYSMETAKISEAKEENTAYKPIDDPMLDEELQKNLRRLSKGIHLDLDGPFRGFVNSYEEAVCEECMDNSCIVAAYGICTSDCKLATLGCLVGHLIGVIFEPFHSKPDHSYFFPSKQKME